MKGIDGHGHDLDMPMYVDNWVKEKQNKMDKGKLYSANYLKQQCGD